MRKMNIYSDGAQSGNVLFFILIAIVLTGLLTVAIQSTTQTGSENIDRETLIIRASQVRQYASELENAVRFVIQNGASEEDIRFAHPDNNADYGSIATTPEFQVFSSNGGGAGFKAPPESINNGDSWEFYGTSHLPDVGSNSAELVAVLPNITQGFCEVINEQLGYDPATQPTDSAACIHSGAAGRFDGATTFSVSPNTADEGTFTVKPALQGCVQCSADSSYHYFKVLMSR